MKALNSYDVQSFLWKMLTVASKHCVTIILRYPIVSSSSFGLFFLYICFPLIFWFLIYSFPIVVAVRIYFSPNGKTCKEEEKINGKPYARVHSVRRRKAKVILREDNSDDQMIDKRPLIEEITKDIRDVEVDSSIVNSASFSSFSTTNSLKHEPGDVSRLESFDGSDEEDDYRNKAAFQWTEYDEKNVMDVGLSEIERNKRLESLIARRKARKLLSNHLRRTLMNMEKLDPPTEISSLVIPKHSNNSFLPDSSNSPIPGSAPSILMPRNPFDIPYDPQEEKPDLREDGFLQEFASDHHKDAIFCRHESFIRGPFAHGEINQCRMVSFLNDFEIRQRASSGLYQVLKPENTNDWGVNRVIDPQPSQVDTPDSVIDDEGGQIKEIIEVHETGIDDNYDKVGVGKIKTKLISDEDLDTSSSSTSSDEDDVPFFKINKEAILHNLLSPARLNAAKLKQSNGDHFSYVASRLQNNSLEEHISNMTMQHHAPSCSLASDMQVEVSEVGSTTLSIDENVEEYDSDSEKICFDTEDLGEESSLFGVNEVSEGNIMEDEFSGTTNPQDLSMLTTMENSIIEDHSIHSCSLTASAPELRYSDEVDPTFLHENIGKYSHDISHENLAYSAAQNEQKSTVDSGQQAGAHTAPTNQSIPTGPETYEHLLEKNEKQDDSHYMTHSAKENISFSEVSKERLNSTITQHDENLMISIDSGSGSFETYQHSGGEPSSTLNSEGDQALPLMPTMGVEHIPLVRISSSSPNSVLQPGFSVTSFDQYIDQYAQQTSTRTLEVPSPEVSENSPPLTEQSLALAHNGGDVEIFPHESTQTPIKDVEASESADTIEVIVNGIPKEVSGSGEILSSHKEPDEFLKPVEGSSLRWLDNDNEMPSKGLGDAHPSSFSESVDDASNSNFPTSSVEDLSKHLETTQDAATQSGAYTLREDTTSRNDQYHNGYSSSTSSNFSEETQFEGIKFEAVEGPILPSPVGEKENSESGKEIECIRESEEHVNSHESKPVAEIN